MRGSASSSKCSHASTIIARLPSISIVGRSTRCLPPFGFEAARGGGVTAGGKLDVIEVVPAAEKAKAKKGTALAAKKAAKA